MIERTPPQEAAIHDGRQVAQNISGIEPSHVARYRWAVKCLAELFPGGVTVLDAACGVGYGSKLLAEAGHQVTGIDISRSAIQFAKTHYQSEGVSYIEGDITEMQLTRADVVVSFETIEHVEDDFKVLCRLRNCSNRILASVPNGVLLPLDGEVTRHHWRHYTDDGFRMLLTRTGFNNVTATGAINKWEHDVLEGRTDKQFMVYMAEGGMK